ncbi:MAG: hypothetical protein ACRC33_31940 [Gemmataceae bacterium]
MARRRTSFGRTLAAVVIGGLLGAWALGWAVSEPHTSLILGGCLGMSAGAGVAVGAGWLQHR